ncbi:MAG: hypothetical protein ACNA7E_05360 [Wenzhouxiangellaceae bacterium]
MKAAVRIPIAALVLVLAGCASYYGRDYAGSGIYYGSSVAHVSGYRGAHFPSYHSSAVPLNPVIYPYWSLDHFYFSSFHHPYSVVVGFHEPLYYPYPGWIYNYHRPRGHFSGRGFSTSFGYPWPASYSRYPHFSHGFFVSSSFGHRAHPRPEVNRVRQIDHRLASLARAPEPASRQALLSGREVRSENGFVPGRSVSDRSLTRRQNALAGRELRAGHNPARDVRSESRPATRHALTSGARSDGSGRDLDGRRADPASLRGRVRVSGQTGSPSNRHEIRRARLPGVAGAVPEADIRQSSSPQSSSPTAGHGQLRRQSAPAIPQRSRLIRGSDDAAPARPDRSPSPMSPPARAETPVPVRGRPAAPAGQARERDAARSRPTRETGPSRPQSSGADHRSSRDGSPRARALRRGRGGN